MSYTRFRPGKSDTYIYGDGSRIYCVACRLHPDGAGWYDTQSFTSRTVLLAHMLRHRRAGHKMPQYAVWRVVKEVEDIGDRYPKEEPT
jgi:hypothetical protein